MSEIYIDYGAITLDNNILKALGYKFDSGLLREMKQFKNGMVKVIQSDIIHNEAVKHLSEDISNTKKTISKALRLAKKMFKISEDDLGKVKEILVLDDQDKEIAKKYLNNFYESVGAVILEAHSNLDCKNLVQMYFNIEAPFENNDKKKNEFPDAIALLSLEKWAEINNTRIIAVSNDKGWKEYSNKSNRVKVVTDLGKALAFFQPHNKVKEIIEHIRKKNLLKDENNILVQIAKEIETNLDCDYEIYAESSYDYEVTNTKATLYDLQVINDDKTNQELIEIVSITSEEIALRIKAIISYEFEAKFKFFTDDLEYHSSYCCGTNQYRYTSEYDTDILLTFTGDFTKEFESIELSCIEILNNLEIAEFGHIGPDFDDDYY